MRAGRFFRAGVLVAAACVAVACGEDGGSSSGSGGSAGLGGSGGGGSGGTAGGVSGGTAGVGASGGSGGSGATGGASGAGGSGGTAVNTCYGSDPPTVRLSQVLTGLNQPIGLAFDPSGSGRVFVIEREGRVRIGAGGSHSLALDISSRVNTELEGGLLGIALHPRFGQGGENRLYLNYTTYGSPMVTVVSEFRMSSGDPDVIDPTENELIRVDQPYTNHNGGALAFGPDGHLYVALGDGGLSPPNPEPQNPATELGSVLRLDVENHPSAPPGNRAENQYVFHIGLRNPFRLSFDQGNGDLYIGDVGEGENEEVDAVAFGSGPHNFGWDRFEGTRCTGLGSCDDASFTAPIHEYKHDAGFSIIGGVVYRGTRIPQLVGRYLFADFYVPEIRSLVWTGSETCDRAVVRTTGADFGSIAMFANDAQGEVFFVDIQYGNLLQLEP